MHTDTIHLLGACTADIHKTVATIEQLLPDVRDYTLRSTLRSSCRQHDALLEQSRRLLREMGQTEKQPGIGAKGMTWLRCSAQMALRRDDRNAAYAVAQTCDHAVKNLCRNRNCYTAAAYPAVDLAGQLIHYAEKLSASMRPFL